MGLEIGIIGLPNAGKSTLFNALRGEQEKLAKTSPVPFTTIDPNVGVVQVPDPLLTKLAEVSKIIDQPKIVPAVVTFIDIAGLIKNAHKGEGLGNQFLGKIREVDAIVHVVAAYEGDINSDKILDDIETVNIELELGDIKNIPTIYVINVNENELANVSMNRFIDTQKKLGPDAQVLIMSAKLEEELIDLDEKERKDYLHESGIKQSVVQGLIASSYKLLDLITFYTIKGGKEISAWSLKNGSTAIAAAATVHTDFAEKFIKAEVVEIDKLLGIESWKAAKEKGLVRLEGKDYIVQNSDVVEFKVGS